MVVRVHLIKLCYCRISVGIFWYSDIPLTVREYTWAHLAMGIWPYTRVLCPRSKKIE